MSASSEHLDENVIASLFERRASSEAIAAVDAHIATCETCRALLRTYAELFEDGGTLDPTVATPPPGHDEPPQLTPSILAWMESRGPARRVGSVLRDKWTLDALLGSGGMGHVYSATHRNGRRGAVKILRPELAANADVVERFLREGYVANRIGHPGTVTILDDDCAEDGAPFLVMELLEGESFGDRLQREGRVPWNEVLDLADEALDVLVVAHRQGIVHRDLKPDNLFLTRAGRLKVLDFGIARIREVSGSSATLAGTAMGTPQYMPPEQARGEWANVDGRTDLFGLGATMYAAVTGRPVREADTPNLALYLAMTEPVKHVREVAPWVPAATADVIDRALAFERDARFPDAEAMQLAVRRAKHATEGTEPMPAITAAAADQVLQRRVGFDPPRARWRLALVGAVVLAAAGVAVAFASSERAPAPIVPIAPTETTSVATPSKPEPAPPSAETVASAEVATPTVAPPTTARTAAPRATTKPARVPAPVGSSAPPLSATPKHEETNPLDLRR